MSHVLTFLSKGVGFKLVALLLTVGMGVGIFQLSGAYKGHALNVHTEIKASPPGIAQIIDQTGQPPSIDSDLGASGESQLSETEPTPPGDNTQPQESSIPSIIKKIIGGDREYEASPPSLINLKSNRSTILTINTDIDFGTVFPEETVQGHFIVSLAGTGNETGVDEPWGPYNAVTYNITMQAVNGAGYEQYKDMTSYLIVQRDPSELPETEPDSTANGTAGDYFAQGHLDTNAVPADTSDKWFVTLEVPDDTGDYWIVILVEVP